MTSNSAVPTDYPIICLIEKKRNGNELTYDEIQAFVNQTVNGKAQDCQIGAMLMAMFLNDLTDHETYSLTKCMMESGEVLSWPTEWSHLLVDKHSTGGVGDKISLILAPALAACGLKVPMISGRGLGHTGGTLDKLESIPGYDIQLTKKKMNDALSNAGCFINGQTPKFVPADMELYKCRDVTATVPNAGLITGSILSKKAAEGVSSLIMDIKVGKGAFMQTVEDADKVASKITRTSKLLGLKTRTVFSRMDSVLGYYVGNALEVTESVLCMKGKGPEDICCLVEELGGNLLEMSGMSKSVDEGKKMIQKSIEDGSALKHFCTMVKMHGVDPNVANQLCNDPWLVLPKVPKSQMTKLPAKRSGIVTGMDGLIIAKCCRDLGAGRMVSSQPINPSVGIRLLVKEGDELKSGDPWIEVHHSTAQIPELIHTRLQQAITISDNSSGFHKKPVVIKVF